MAFEPYKAKEDPVKRKTPRIGPLPYTDDWFEDRRSTIGASEAAGVCGVSRYAQPLEIFNRKKHGEESREQTKAQRRGHIFESAVLQLYGDRVGGHMMRNCPMLVHPKWAFMSATPDAIWHPEESQSPTCFDAKTTQLWDEFGDEGSDDIPQEYIFQAQQQMAVTGAPRCDLPVLRSGSFDVSIYSVVRNEDLIEIIREAEQEMMDRIKNDDPPEPNWEHPKTYDVIRKTMCNVVEQSSVVLDEHLQELWDESKAMASERTRIEKEIKKRKAKILYALGENAIGCLPDGRQLVRRKIQVSAREVPASEYVRLDCKKGS